MDAARVAVGRLCSYQAVKQCHVLLCLMLTVPGQIERISDYHNIKVVFTKGPDCGRIY